MSVLKMSVPHAKNNSQISNNNWRPLLSSSNKHIYSIHSAFI
jgi:hypothetical protein